MIKINLKKISLFDLTLCFSFIFIVLLIGLFFFRSSRFIKIEIRLITDNPYVIRGNPFYWLAEKVEEGLCETDGLGKKIVEIKKVKSYEFTGDRKEVYLEALVKATYNKRKDQYTFRGKPLFIGSQVVLNPQNLYLSGIVVNIEGKQREYQEKTVKISISEWNEEKTTNGIDPEEIKELKKGAVFKGINDEVLATLLEIERNPAKRVVVSSTGASFLTADPYLVECFLTVRLKVTESQGVMYFMDDYKVKAREWIPLYFEDFNVAGKILEIID